MSYVLDELSKPFHPSHISFKPGATTQDKSRCMVLTYADLRAYQQRLDAVLGVGWQVTYSPWGDGRIVCHLTILDEDGMQVVRSSTGELDRNSEQNEIGGTVAEAQAFKRACAMFGLGRYLYSLDLGWVDYDAQKRRIPDHVQAKLRERLAAHYNQEVAEDVAAGPVSFEGRNDAAAWAVEQGAFPNLDQAIEHYNVIRKQVKPQSPQVMWDAWVGDVRAILGQ